jgi:hypothetical protein
MAARFRPERRNIAYVRDVQPARVFPLIAKKVGLMNGKNYHITSRFLLREWPPGAFLALKRK